MNASTGISDCSCLDLYADGSFCRELGIGAWAFCVPRLNLSRTGSSVGATVARFEFLAVLHGLEEVVAVDRSDLPLHVFSDCNSTVAAINWLRDGKPQKAPARFSDRSDLLPRLVSILEQRLVQVTRYTGGSKHHRTCHRSANRRLREEIAKDPDACRRLILVRQNPQSEHLIMAATTILSESGSNDQAGAHLKPSTLRAEIHQARGTEGDRT